MMSKLEVHYLKAISCDRDSVGLPEREIPKPAASSGPRVLRSVIFGGVCVGEAGAVPAPDQIQLWACNVWPRRAYKGPGERVGRVGRVGRVAI